jgi:hypothetical protein
MTIKRYQLFINSPHIPRAGKADVGKTCTAANELGDRYGNA